MTQSSATTGYDGMIFELILLTCMFLVFYTYALYPAILYIVSKVKRNAPSVENEYLPHVTMLIPVYNEKSVIIQKLDNCRRLAYPQDKLEILIGSDASTDGSDAIIKKNALPNIRFFAYDEREGKSHVLSKLIKKSSGEILIFSDANTFYNPYAIKNLARNFADKKIGGVCGKLILVNPDGNVGGWGESRYWQYENYIKYLEGKIYTTVGATGGIYAIRRELASDLPPDHMVSDDLVMALLIAGKGYRVVFEKEAVAIEATTKSMADEFLRKKRIGIGNFQALKMIAHCLDPRKGFVAFALWSHKIIRWFSPFFLIGAFFSNMFLLDREIFVFSFVFQILFYLCALIGWALERRGKKNPLFSYPLYFVVAHYALLLSFFQILGRTHDPRWEQTSR